MTMANVYEQKSRRDNWENRSQEMACETCMWFVEKKKNPDAPQTTGLLFGRCRKRAPCDTGFPVVYGDDWCGAHRLDENKL